MRLLVVILICAACFQLSDAQWGYSPYYGGGYGGYDGYGSYGGYYPSYSYSYYPSYGYSNYGYNNYGYGGYGGYNNYGYGGFCGIRCRRFQRRLRWAQMMNPYGMYGKK